MRSLALVASLALRLPAPLAQVANSRATHARAIEPSA